MVKNNRRLVLLIILFISVVAFCTVQTTAKVKEKYKETYINQVYATYSQNLQHTNDILGKVSCYISDNGKLYTRNCMTFYKTYLQNLPINKYCRHNKDGETDCTPNYIVDSKSDCAFLFNKIIYEYSDAVSLKNNNIMIIAAKDKKMRLPLFAIDINGSAPPNVAGDDLVLLVLRKNDSDAFFIDMDTSFCKDIPKTEKPAK